MKTNLNMRLFFYVWVYIVISYFQYKSKPSWSDNGYGVAAVNKISIKYLSILYLRK